MTAWKTSLRAPLFLLVIASLVMGLSIGYLAARDSHPSRIIQTDLTGHGERHGKGPEKTPRACYGTAPGHDTVREKNPNCKP